MSNLKKKITNTDRNKLIITTVLVLALMIAVLVSTLAYLASTTNTLHNVMESGRVSAWINESITDNYGVAQGDKIPSSASSATQSDGNTYTLVPGYKYTKDPVMHIEANSEDCFAYIIVDDQLLSAISDVYDTSDGNQTPIGQLTSNGWTEMTGVNLPTGISGRVFYYVDEKKQSTTEQDIKTFDYFKLNKALTSDQINSLNNYEITVNGAVIQSYGFSATTGKTVQQVAWESVYGTKTYTVSYRGNGAVSGLAPGTATYAEGATVTVLDNTGNMKNGDYVFGGWNTDPDGNGTEYHAGDTFTITADTILYAQWWLPFAAKNGKGKTVRYAPILDGKTVAVGQIGVMSRYQSSGQIFTATPTVEVTGGKAYQLSDISDAKTKGEIPTDEATMYFRGGSFKAARSLSSDDGAVPIGKTFDPDTCVGKGNYCYPSLKIDELLYDKTKDYAAEGDEICQMVPSDGSDPHNYTPSIDGVSIDDLLAEYGGNIFNTNSQYTYFLVPVFDYNSYSKSVSSTRGRAWDPSSKTYSELYERLDPETLTYQHSCTPIVSKVFSD